MDIILPNNIFLSGRYNKENEFSNKTFKYVTKFQIKMIKHKYKIM